MDNPPARIGYAGVSTADQNPDTRITALNADGCTMVPTESGSGTTLAGRPELGTILDFIHPGETLVVTRIDRLARSMRDLQVNDGADLIDIPEFSGLTITASGNDAVIDPLSRAEGISMSRAPPPMIRTRSTAGDESAFACTMPTRRRGCHV